MCCHFVYTEVFLWVATYFYTSAGVVVWWEQLPPPSHHSLIHLNTCFLIGRTVWVGLRGVTLEEVGVFGVGFVVLKACAIASWLCSSAWTCRLGCNLSATSPAPSLPATTMLPTMTIINSGTLNPQTECLFFSISRQVFFVWQPWLS